MCVTFEHMSNLLFAAFFVRTVKLKFEIWRWTSIKMQQFSIFFIIFNCIYFRLVHYHADVRHLDWHTSLFSITVFWLTKLWNNIMLCLAHVFVHWTLFSSSSCIFKRLWFFFCFFSFSFFGFSFQVWRDEENENWWCGCNSSAFLCVSI